MNFAKQMIIAVFALGGLALGGVGGCDQDRTSGAQVRDIGLHDDGRYVKDVIYSTPPTSSGPAKVHLRHCEPSSDSLDRTCPKLKPGLSMPLRSEYARRLAQEGLDSNEVDEILSDLLESKTVTYKPGDPLYAKVKRPFKTLKEERKRERAAEERRREEERRRRAEEERRRRENNRFWNCRATCTYQERVIPLYGGDGSWDNEQKTVFAGCRGRSHSICDADLREECSGVCNQSWFSMEWRNCRMSNIRCE